MREDRMFRFPGFIVQVLIATDSVEAHSRATDHPYIVATMLNEIQESVFAASEKLDIVEMKPVRKAEGC